MPTKDLKLLMIRLCRIRGESTMSAGYQGPSVSIDTDEPRSIPSGFQKGEGEMEGEQVAEAKVGLTLRTVFR
jgi:hypothetical protein